SPTVITAANAHSAVSAASRATIFRRTRERRLGSIPRSWSGGCGDVNPPAPREVAHRVRWLPADRGRPYRRPHRVAAGAAGHRVEHLLHPVRLRERRARVRTLRHRGEKIPRLVGEAVLVAE